MYPVRLPVQKLEISTNYGAFGLADRAPQRPEFDLIFS